MLLNLNKKEWSTGLTADDFVQHEKDNVEVVKTMVTLAKSYGKMVEDEKGAVSQVSAPPLCPQRLLVIPMRVAVRLTVAVAPAVAAERANGLCGGVCGQAGQQEAPRGGGGRRHVLQHQPVPRNDAGHDCVLSK